MRTKIRKGDGPTAGWSPQKFWIQQPSACRAIIAEARSENFVLYGVYRQIIIGAADLN